MEKQPREGKVLAVELTVGEVRLLHSIVGRALRETAGGDELDESQRGTLLQAMAKLHSADAVDFASENAPPPPQGI